LYHRGSTLTALLSHIIDVQTYLRESTIFHDTWPDMRVGRENWWSRVNWQKIELHCGKPSRTNLKSLAQSVAKALRGKLTSLHHAEAKSSKIDLKCRMDALKRHQAKQHH
jgi:hypothetical protein